MSEALTEPEDRIYEEKQDFSERLEIASVEAAEDIITSFILLQKRIEGYIEACSARVKPLYDKYSYMRKRVQPTFKNWVWEHLPRTAEGEIKQQNVKTAAGAVYWTTRKPNKLLALDAFLSDAVQDFVTAQMEADGVDLEGIGLRLAQKPCLQIKDLDLWSEFAREHGIVSKDASPDPEVVLRFGTKRPWGDTSPFSYFERLVKKKDSTSLGTPYDND